MEVTINCTIKFNEDDGLSFDQIRHRMKLSKRAFAQMLGVSSQAVYNWETGKSKPRREIVMKAMEAFNDQTINA